jgi:probable F420-dependent oxidoreductase
MRIGISFPTTTIGTDVSVIRDYIQAVEGAGFDHMTAVDHVLGAHPDRFTEPLDGLRLTAPPYTTESEIHEVFTLFGYGAAITERLEFATGILVLPQRQTQLVAKQAAAVDVFSKGRMRLGIGVGWNYAEFGGMGSDFHTRGRRIEEQIEVLRLLWTEPLVTFSGRWHTIDRMSINPRPVQRPIPIWIGCGMEEPLVRRVAKLADGWMPRQIGEYGEPFPVSLERLQQYAQEAGRDPKSIGVEVRVNATLAEPQPWLQRVREMQELGVTHITLSTSRDAPAGAALVESVPQYRRMLDEVVAA